MMLTLKFITLFTVWQVAYLCSLFLIANYYRPGGYLAWTTPISFHYLLDGLQNLTLMDIKNTILNPYETAIHLFHGICSVISLIVFYVALGMPSKRAFIIFTILSVVLLFAGGGLGALHIFFDFVTLSIPDGEWLSEGWPNLDVRAIWMFSCMYLCWEFYKHYRTDDKSTEGKSV